MNRRDRRAAQRRQSQSRDPHSAERIRELQDRVETTGKPGYIHGLTDACRDCHAEGALILLPGKYVIGEIFHDEHCPAANGVTTWGPVP